MEFTGKIIAILQPRGGVSKASGNEWKAQEYVIEDHGQYPRKMCFDVFGADKIEQFNIQMGEELTVSFDIDARQWQDRWFNSIRAWKVERVSAALQPCRCRKGIYGSDHFRRKPAHFTRSHYRQKLSERERASCYGAVGFRLSGFCRASGRT